MTIFIGKCLYDLYWNSLFCRSIWIFCWFYRAHCVTYHRMIFLYVSAKRFSRHHHFRGSWSPQLFNLSRRSGPAKVFGKFTELERHHARDTHWAKIFKKVPFSTYLQKVAARALFTKIILKMEMNWGIKLILVFLVIHIVSF